MYIFSGRYQEKKQGACVSQVNKRFIVLHFNQLFLKNNTVPLYSIYKNLKFLVSNYVY